MNEKSTPPRQGAVDRALELLDSATALISEHAASAVPFGSAEAVADEALAVIAATGRLHTATAALLATAERHGGTRAKGHRDLADYTACQAGLTRAHGQTYAQLAHPPAGVESTLAALDDGALGLGKATRIIHWVRTTLPKRCTTTHPDPAAFAEAAQSHLLPLALQPDTTCRDIDHLGRRLNTLLAPEEAEDTERHRHRDRSATLAQHPEGGFYFVLQGDSASGDAWRAALEAFQGPPAPDDDRGPDQRLFDAALDLAHAATAAVAEGAVPGRAPVALRLTVPLDTLRGVPGSPPAVSDYGTIWPAWAARSAAGHCTLTRVLTHPMTGQPLDVGRTQRLCPPRLRDAVIARHTTCQWQHGCDHPAAWCEIDHITAWWEGGATSIDNLQPLCRRHNVEKERQRRLHAAAPAPLAARPRSRPRTQRQSAPRSRRGARAVRQDPLPAPGPAPPPV